MSSLVLREFEAESWLDAAWSERHKKVSVLTSSKQTEDTNKHKIKTKEKNTFFLPRKIITAF
jgi:hypothetical protein